MPEKQFWARAPIYIVICVLLGFVIAGLLAQNIQLKNDLAEVKTEQREQQAKTEDVPPQLSTGAETGGTSFLDPAPDNGARQQPNQPVDNSPGNSGQTPANPANPQTENPRQPGLLTPILNPLCTNLTPRACATLGL